MKRRRVYFLVFVALAVVVAVGIRTSTGQGYSDPVVSPKVKSSIAATPARTLEVRLTNRKTGRSQYYEWSLSVPPGGSVEIECHEWTFVRWFGVQMFGAPRNSFRRIVPHDAAEEGIADPYNCVIRWRTKTA